MGGDGTVLGVVIAGVSVIGSVLVARISTPRPASDRPDPEEVPREGELRVSPAIWERFAVLEAKVDHLTAIVEEQKEKVGRLDRLLRTAMRIIRRANRRLVAAREVPEEIPR
ncbi:hypothetical protein ABZ650_20660, partial [Streptomyces griseoviridis]|uniref:hypothetical protein n=1 Tax=Streptomyces griseoviridis TaxID=45398 RepID=UPI0033FD338F